jgi:beta-glucosidase
MNAPSGRFTCIISKNVDAGALSVMAAYNKVNGIYCCENKPLLTEILREEWGFDGFTMSDFMWGLHDTADALKAGLDAEMPIAQFYSYHRIKKCIARGLLSLEDVDRAVRNILGVLVRLTPGILPQPKSIMKCKEHLELAGEAAVKGMVLLKNENSLLPLASTTAIAVVGPYADRVNVGDKGSNHIVTKDGVTAFAGLSRKFPNASVYNGLDPQKALAVAARAEIVIACIGCDSKDEGEFLFNVGGKVTRKPKYAVGGDRDSLQLNPAQLELVKSLKKAGKKVIAVLHTGSVILTENLEAYADGIIMGYYGGIGFGNALAALVCGEANFSGKLPVSIAKQESDYPPFLEIGQKPYEIDYGYYNGYYLFEKNGSQPSYPFGFGLSYTNFDIQGIQALKNSHGGITVTASIKNIGDRSGAEVLQVYVGSGGADDHRPVKMLRGFKRVELEPGESKTVAIDIAVEDLKFYQAQKKAWLLDTVYKVYAGNSSAQAAHVADINMQGHRTPEPPPQWNAV